MFGNLYKLAATVIPQQTVQWSRFLSREQDARGRWVNTYDTPEDVTGSFQPVDARDVKRMGFDEDKTYAQLFTAHDMQNVSRETSPDRITYNGETYDIVGESDWYNQDGWKPVYCVKVEPL